MSVPKTLKFHCSMKFRRPGLSSQAVLFSHFATTLLLLEHLYRG